MVTGSEGFIGAHVVSSLLRQGWTVSAVDRRSPAVPTYEARVTHHRMDVGSRDFTRLVRTARPDVIVHLAAQSSLAALERQPDQGLHDNVLSTANLVEAAGAAGVRKVVFASSAAVYGSSQQLPAREDAEIRPTSAYGWSKAAGEQLVQRASVQYGTEYVILRLANVYGPGQELKAEPGVIALWYECLLSGKRMRLHDQGRPTRDFVYVGDVAEAVSAAAIQGAAETLNVASGRETSLAELATLMSAIANVEPAFQPYAAPPGDIDRSVLDPRRALHALGWKALSPLELGLRRMWSHLLSSGWAARRAAAAGNG
jgi:UDP-glucose 4-epimerase